MTFDIGSVEGNMTIIYGLIARAPRTVLVEHTLASGNFTTFSRVLLGKIDYGSEGRFSYDYDEHSFHLIIDQGIVFLCMTDDRKRGLAFAFLDALMKDFAPKMEEAKTAIAFSMMSTFEIPIANLMNHYNSSSADKLAIVNAKLEDTKQVMVQNIDAVLERGEKLDLLVNKTENLQNEAFKFQKGATSLKNEMWWRKVKMYLLIVGAIGVLIFIICWIACGARFEKCPTTAAPTNAPTSRRL